MGALGTGKRRKNGQGSSIGRRDLDLHALIPHQLDTRTPVFPAVPISPEERCGTNGERMEQDAHLARLCCGSAIPLALLAQGTGPTTANAGSIDYAQAPIGFSTVFMWDQFLVGRATQRSIRLESKILATEATSLP